VDIAGLQNPAKIGFVGFAAAQALDRSVLVPERPEERERKLRRIEGLLDQLGNGLFNLDRIHTMDSSNA
jgi:hypothetical protein